MTSMTRDDYEEYAILLGGELLEHVNFSDLAEVLNTDKYSFDQDQESIYQLLQTGQIF